MGKKKVRDAGWAERELGKVMVGKKFYGEEEAGDLPNGCEVRRSVPLRRRQLGGSARGGGVRKKRRKVAHVPDGDVEGQGKGWVVEVVEVEVADDGDGDDEDGPGPSDGSEDGDSREGEGASEEGYDSDAAMVEEEAGHVTRLSQAVRDVEIRDKGGNGDAGGGRGGKVSGSAAKSKGGGRVEAPAGTGRQLRSRRKKNIPA